MRGAVARFLLSRGPSGPPPGQASHTLIVICSDSNSDSDAYTQMSIHVKIHTLGHTYNIHVFVRTLKNPNFPLIL